jgi:hypothetical protein
LGFRDQVSVKGIYVPLKHWPELYAKHRGDIFSTALKANIQRHRSKLEADDVARATQEFGNPDSNEFAKHFYSL